jgi:PEP-CTERM motif
MVAVAQLELAAVASAPEASTWVMMLLGFAALGFAGYRTSRKECRIRSIEAFDKKSAASACEWP